MACEYRMVAFRPEHCEVSGKTRQEVEFLVEMLEAVAEPVMVIVRHRRFSPDAADDMVLDVAVNGHADAMMTHHTNHFREPAKRFGVATLTPSEVLRELQRRS
jgi:predicted nucleic acid-binding protein